MASSGTRCAGLSLEGFTLNAVSDSMYHDVLWPQLGNAIDLMLSASTTDSRQRLSYEETYSAIYRLVCQGYGPMLQADLMHKKIDVFIDMLDESLQTLKTTNAKEYIERFAEALEHYIQGIQSVVAVFIYLSRCQVQGQLAKLLLGRINERLVVNHIQTILDYLEEAEKHPFSVEPATFASLIKSLYKIDEDNAKLNPSLFRKFIPGLMSHTGHGQLDALSQEAKEMFEHLQNTTSPEDRSDSLRKRSLEGDDGPGMDDS